MKKSKKENFRICWDKLNGLEEKINNSIIEKDIDKALDLIDNRGRLILVLEKLATQICSEDEGFKSEISKLYNSITQFNADTEPKLYSLKNHISQQIAQTYKNKVSLRGYRSTNVKG